METKSLNRVELIFEPCEGMDATLASVFKYSNDEITSELIDSGLRGRGGAGFPTGLKWKFTAATPGDEKYVICNADEGEPGTFKDREILAKVPEKIFVGMAIAAKVIGAKEGFIYLRYEYKFMLKELQEHVDLFNDMIKGYLDFKISFRLGAGAYVCGEESALFESMEGKRGEPRNKPPYPTISGFRGKPTIINNVETLAFATMIIKYGAERFKSLGTQDSRGTKVFSVSGDLPNAGIYELELGMTLQKFVDEFSDGDAKAVQVGGASGFCVPRKKFKDTIIGFEGVPTGGSMMVFNSSRSMYNVLHNYLDFFVEESCGQCTPCRVGCQQLLKGLKAVKKGEKPESYLEDLLKLSRSMQLTAKCGLGQSVGNSFASIVENFKEEMVY
ncbi:MAG: NADH-ubiquinone oxidoreductase-F iron-sulfur binding region domain-containing protein [bacterium]